MKKICLALSLLAISLAACQTTGKNSATTISGENLGSAEWRDIDPSYGKLILPSHQALQIVKTSERDLPAMYQQVVTVKNGFVRLSVLHTRGYAENTDKGSFLSIARSVGTEKRRFVSPSATRNDVHKSRGVTYITSIIEKHPCVVFYRVFGNQLMWGTESMRNAGVTGLYCGQAGDDAGKVTSEVVDYAARIKVDN